MRIRELVRGGGDKEIGMPNMRDVNVIKSINEGLQEDLAKMQERGISIVHKGEICGSLGDVTGVGTLERVGLARSVLMAFAGPNGSGKSTMINQLFKGHLEREVVTYINADDIKKNGNFSDSIASGISEEVRREMIAESAKYIADPENMLAAKIATHLREAALDAGESFMMETVLSSRRNLDLMKDAKAKGYHVDVSFITTDDSDINVGRVAARVQAGGHDVLEETIRARYEKCLALLPEILDVADTAAVYDNSFAEYTMIVSKEKGVIELHPMEREGSKWDEKELKNLIPKGKVAKKEIRR